MSKPADQGGAGGAAEVLPVPASVVADAQSLLPQMLERLTQIALTPSRGDVTSVSAIREIIALARVTDGASDGSGGQDAARVYVLVRDASEVPSGAVVLDAGALAAEARRRLRGG